MDRPLHHRAFAVTVGWTLILLFLGSIVHATESSLACPDWPTCYGTMVPEMSGGIFWEHLHRLVAGGLVLMWLLATYLAWAPERDRPWIRRATFGGIVLLVIQSVLGGVTVILELPDAISTSHLALAFLFLALATGLTVATHPRWGRHRTDDRDSLRTIRAVALPVTGLVLLQSVLGAWVRHADAGMACPDVPLCLGEWVPPLEQHLIAIHWAHRVLGVLLGLGVLALAGVVLARSAARPLRRTAVTAGVLVLIQVTLGFLSVGTFLAVIPVSLHTLVAAALLAATTAVAVWTWEPAGDPGGEVPGPGPARDGVVAEGAGGR